MSPQDEFSDSSEDDADAETQVEEIEMHSSGQGGDGQEALYVVGIGASAGGLKALRSFFNEFSSGTRTAFVVVVHLSPDNESQLAEILDLNSALHVQEVKGRTRMEADHVYIIPPGKNIEITDGHLVLTSYEEPRWKRAPVDHFFQTLAFNHPNGIGILFSGGGSDGTRGMKAIKEQGGLLMVQDPEEAEHKSMLQSAIGTGEIDFVLPARELAQKVVELTKNADLYRLVREPESLPESDESVLQTILAHLKERVGHDFSGYKRSTVLRRLQRRMRVNMVDSLSTYLGYLKGHEGEASKLFADLLISVTGFFRDPEAWEALERDIIPKLFKGKQAGEQVRAWVPGCATGEEAYSLAMLLLEYADDLDNAPSIQVFACDLDRDAIETARKGIYPDTISADLSSDRLNRFFHKHDNHYQANRKLRNSILFAPHNLLKDPPFSRQDLIVCRNLLIYLRRNLQKKVLGVFHYALKPGGHLFLGHSETANSHRDFFQAVDKIHCIYARRRLPDNETHLLDLPLSVSPFARGDATHSPQVNITDTNSRSNAELHRESLEEYAPPSILLNEEREILHASPAASRYLEYPSGNPTSEILRAIRKELRLELRTMIKEAFDKEKPSTRGPIRTVINNDEKHVHLMVRPAGKEGRSKLALVLFVEVEERPHQEDGTDAADETGPVRALEKELATTKRQLQSTVKEYETSEAELMAANEKLQSINEEYRSTLEELGTSQKELQSVNEELQTVNAELNHKVSELTKANNDHRNLMSSTEVATVFLNRKLQIDRYTPRVKELFNIRERDHGCPLEQVTHKFVDYETMVSDAEEVLQSLVPMEREVQDKDNHWYLVRLIPYRTIEDHIEGVVITFVDITRLKRAQDRARYIEVRHKLLLERVKEYAIFTMDEKGCVSTWNPGAEHILGYSEDEILGKPGALIFTPEDRADDAAVAELTEAAREGQASDERWHVRKSGERFWGSGVMTALYTDDGALRGFAKVLRDNTQRRETMDALKESRQQLKDLNESLEEQVATRTAALEKKSQQLRQLASQLVIAEQRERHRIAQMLHDDLQQHLYSIQMRITMLAKSKSKEWEEVKPKLEEANDHLEHAIDRTRNLTVDLSPPVLQGEGLVDALEWLVSQMEELHDLHVEVEADEAFYPAADEMRVLLFQVVRELLFNVVKHAGTDSASVELERIDHHLQIRVSDNGIGCDPDEVFDREKSDGFGLPHLRQRITLFDGEMNIDSAPGHGMTVTITVPVQWADVELK